MLAKLKLELEYKEELSYQMASLFHGALMELLPMEYADYLHKSGLHPFTQYLEMKERKWYWIVTCLNEDAVKKIIHNVLMQIDSIEIKKKKFVITIVQKQYQELNEEELMNCFYEGQGKRYIQIQFLTPTAFKKQGKYCFYPDLKCIYQSLMNKYDCASNEDMMCDEDTLEQLNENSQVIRYDLKSTYFHLEGVRIPSFIGKITIKLTGTQTMANFAKLLFEFGEYSGIGIKTALGMGAIKILDEGRGKIDK
ncbi:MAG: CRISPR-associated endoribonuclease Cas6 [Lachnospiraceae bacterium]|nr:CRISPR-associated endoribonuclease Cas6 [Lachnospiraceae bacterium]